MADNEKKKKPVKKAGRPKNKPYEDEVVDETGQERLDMAKSEEDVSIDQVNKKWKELFSKFADYDKNTGGTSKLTTVVDKWNKLNPFLQNQRIKRIYSQAKRYEKADISSFLASPGNHEEELRSLGWANASSQQIYYNILRRSADVPLYNYFLTPEYLYEPSEYKEDKFKNEDRLINDWIELFNIPNTFKTIALEVKREGKSSYLFRNKFVGNGSSKAPAFTTLQKLPTEWTKITGKSQLGFTVSFNMTYFLNIANNPSDFGDFMEAAWNDIIAKGIVTKITDLESGNLLRYELADDIATKALNYTFEFGGQMYKSSLEFIKKNNYLLWLRMPWDMCFTFGSDNSHPWVAPDTMGLMLKLQELTDYGQLAGLIASTPLTAILTGEIEPIPNPRAGKNESIFSPEILDGWATQFNAATSTNIECWGFPFKNIKLQQLSSDVNSSDIISTATENFIESAGEGGLTITDTKPNVAMVKTAQLLSASQQRYVTLQFENVMNFIIQHKLGMQYRWKLQIWGDIFSIETEKKNLKENVIGGNMALLPKLMSAERMSIRDTKAVTEYIKSLDFYKDFVTYTQLKTAELGIKAQKEAEQQKALTGDVGRPKLGDEEIENDATAASRERGDNTADNRI